MLGNGSALKHILGASRAFRAPAADDAVGVASLVCLLVLVCADMAFIAAHLLSVAVNLFSRGDPIAGSAYNLGAEGGYSEVFQYLKVWGIGFVLCVLWSRTRDKVYGAWLLLFAYVICDDALQIHERGGKLIAAYFGYEPAFGLQPKDFGELTVWGAFGVAFLTAITAAYLKSSFAARKASLGIGQLFCLLAFFGAVMDMAHSAVPARLLKAAFGVLEDGGEMLVMSLICWYVVKVLERGGKAPDLLFKLEWLTRR
jgi:hypothetical protein